MYRDVTGIPNTVNCIKIIDDKSLIVYMDGSTMIYKLVSNKYYATDFFDPDTPKTTDVCYTYQEVQTLPSNFDFVTPIYHVTAIACAAFLFFFAYRLIVHPWWRKR